MNPFDAVCRAIEASEGHALDRLTLSVLGETADTLELGLRWGPEKPDTMLSFSSIYYFALGRMPGPGATVFDRVTTRILSPSDEPWPEEIPLEVSRTPDLPLLLWLRVEGPLQLEVVAAIATAFTEVT